MRVEPLDAAWVLLGDGEYLCLVFWVRAFASRRVEVQPDFAHAFVLVFIGTDRKDDRRLAGLALHEPAHVHEALHAAPEAGGERCAAPDEEVAASRRKIGKPSRSAWISV